jgi:hypothetical protein
MHIAIIGAGAAGCFAAIELRRRAPHCSVTLYERATRPLIKVGLTGGGRCNLSNVALEEVDALSALYPRGERLMKRLLREFGVAETCRWFEAEGVPLTVQEDGCVFPASQEAAQVVRTLTRLMHDTGARLETGKRLTALARVPYNMGEAYELTFADGSCTRADAVLVTTGGAPKSSGLAWLDAVGVERVAPVPSLFALCVEGEELHRLSGTVVPEVTLALCGTKLRATGTLLLTHLGISGPATLRLSAYAARPLAEGGYRAPIAIGWLSSVEEAQHFVRQTAAEHPRQQLASRYPDTFVARLWDYLLRRASLDPARRWGELGTRDANRLVELLTHDRYLVTGRNPYKEEFVTCGGVALTALQPRTLEAKNAPGLYFAGEVLDLDGVTGGYNLQAAWTTGYVAARALAARASSGE